MTLLPKEVRSLQFAPGSNLTLPGVSLSQQMSDTEQCSDETHGAQRAVHSWGQHVAGQGHCAKAADGRQDGMAEWESGELREYLIIYDGAMGSSGRKGN